MRVLLEKKTGGPLPNLPRGACRGNMGLPLAVKEMQTLNSVAVQRDANAQFCSLGIPIWPPVIGQKRSSKKMTNKRYSLLKNKTHVIMWLHPVGDPLLRWAHGLRYCEGKEQLKNKTVVILDPSTTSSSMNLKWSWPQGFAIEISQANVMVLIPVWLLSSVYFLWAQAESTTFTKGIPCKKCYWDNWWPTGITDLSKPIPPISFQ